MEKIKTKVLPLSEIKVNQQNPRVISESRLKKLINSLLVFPAMLSLRPIVIDDTNIILGGNMRQTALSRISQLTFDELVAQLETLPEYNELPDGGAAVREYWEAFLSTPQVEVVYASQLSESEKQQFIIKDNVSFGDWDYEELENWDAEKLESWGVDTLLPDFGNEKLQGEGEGNSAEADARDNKERTIHQRDPESEIIMANVSLFGTTEDMMLTQILSKEDADKLIALAKTEGADNLMKRIIAAL